MQWQVQRLNQIAVLALPTAQIAVMGPEAAVNAVYANKIAAYQKKSVQALLLKNEKSIRKILIFTV